MFIWYYICFGIFLLFIIAVIVWLIVNMTKEKNNPTVKKKE
jgi:hypothetical protein